MGLPQIGRGHAARRPHPVDPDLQRRPRRVRSASGGAGAVRQRRRSIAHWNARAPGDPYPGFEQDFSSFPIPGTTARTWYLGPAGALTDQPPTSPGINWYHLERRAPFHSPTTEPTPVRAGCGATRRSGSGTGQQNPSGTAVSYVSAPLTATTTVIGAGAVDLWVRSSTPDVDLQATISEVRPDGNETFVQNGWIRASERKLSTDSNNMFKQPSTALEPIPTFAAADASPMPAGQFVKVVIPLYYEGHVYRAGSRIRVTISAPNGTQPVWSFGQTEPTGTGTVSIAFSTAMPSSLVLPVVPGVSVPTPLPACPSLRNEPCRPYRAVVDNTSTQ